MSGVDTIVQRVTPHHPLPSARKVEPGAGWALRGPEPPVWQDDVYETLTAALGAAAVTGIVRRFKADLRSRFADHADREGLRCDAHAIVSTAGMLGFTALSDAAAALEQACVGDEDLTESLATLLAARHATERSVAALLGTAAPEPQQLP